MTVTNLTPPVITGTARVGQTLFTSNGTWDFDLDFLEYTYQWRRCDATGASCVNIGGATSSSYTLQNADLGAKIRARVTATETNVDPSPPPGDLPFPEADLRPGYTTISGVAANTQNLGGSGSPVAGGNDCLIDLQMTKRTIGSLLIWGKSGQRIKVVNGWWEITKAIDGSPYWRGGPRIRSSDGVGPEHISFTDCIVQGSTVPDCVAMAAGQNTKVTIQRTRLESRFAWDGQNSNEPAEHCDACQVQGLIGAVEIGLCTVYCMNVASPNEGGKCFQLKKEGGNDGFSVSLKKVNMRGGGRTGTWLLQTTRDITVSLTDVYAKDDGITTGAAWTWATSGGGMFYPNSSAGAVGWTRSGSSGSYIASWPPASGVTGQIREGLPPGGDYVTRAMLGV